MIRIGNQIRGPVVEHLDTAKLYAHVLHVNPAVRDNIVQGLQLRLVLQIQLIHQQSHRHEITIGQSSRNLAHLFRHIVHTAYQILHRHGGNEYVALDGMLLAVLYVGQALYPAVHGMQSGHLATLTDLAAHLLYLRRSGLPELARAVLGIIELLDQGGLYLVLVLLLRHQLLYVVLQDSHNGKSLGTLCAPGSVDLTGVTSPQLLCVALEEHGVQLLAEAIDIEVLQGILRLLGYGSLQIAEARHHGGGKAHVLDGSRIDFDRIVVKLLSVIDTGYTVTCQHHPVFLLRIRSACRQGHLASQLLIIVGGSALQGHNLVPPLCYPVVLGEETVSADIHPVAIVTHCAGDTADLLTLLQNQYLVLIRLF